MPGISPVPLARGLKGSLLYLWRMYVGWDQCNWNLQVTTPGANGEWRTETDWPWLLDANQFPAAEGMPGQWTPHRSQWSRLAQGHRALPLAREKLLSSTEMASALHDSHLHQDLHFCFCSPVAESCWCGSRWEVSRRFREPSLMSLGGQDMLRPDVLSTPLANVWWE